MKLRNSEMTAKRPKKKAPGDILSFYRARLAREKGFIKKKLRGKLRVALAYPSTYHVGMSNLGFQVVYHLFNSRPDVAAERVFLPDDLEMSLLLRAGKPLLSSESQIPLHDFDLVAFSLSFENDYPNILQILKWGKIPLTSRDRSASHPLVMGGGITTFLNPEPLARVMDFFLLGEAEACLNAFLIPFIENKSQISDKRTLLKALTRKVKGLYVPSLYEPRYREDGTLGAFRPVEEDLPAKIEVACADEKEDEPWPVAVSGIMTPDTEFGDRYLVEIGRGCGRSCRFCAAGYVYRPPRVHRASDIAACLESDLKKADRVGLVSTAVSDFPGIESLTKEIVEKGCTFSLSSLRADALNPDILQNLKNAGQKTLAIAPEAGTDRLRKVINKHLVDAQIIDAVRLISETGTFTIRLYFLIGLPTETLEDIAGIVKLVKKIKHHMVKASAPRGKIAQIKLSVNCFVPKPFTPFQWFPMASISSLKEKQKMLRKSLLKEGGIKISFDVARWAYVQALLSLGDRRAGDILLNCHKEGGDWKMAFRTTQINPDFFVHREKEKKERLPWDFIDHGLKKSHLWKEHGLALEEKESEICHVGKCFRCGVCEKMEDKKLIR
jgi:radical SAM family uncharacterized protein